jgi:threonyl-tRNA synthetase
VILTISSQSDEYAQSIHNYCLKHGIRAELDIRNEKISYKIREHISVKIPILFIIGQKETEDKTVTIREIGNNEQETLSFEDAVNQVKDRSIPPDLIG